MNPDSDKARIDFLTSAKEWLADPYSVDIRYLAINNQNEVRIAEAAITFSPLPPKNTKLSFSLYTNTLIAGHSQLIDCPEKKLETILNKSVEGIIKTAGNLINLESADQLQYSSEMRIRDQWFSPLHLRITTNNHLQLSSLDPSFIDNQLRTIEPPFDGLRDLTVRLNFNDPFLTNISPTIDVRILPPVDINFEDSGISNGYLSLTLHAHEKLDTKKVILCVITRSNDGDDIRENLAPKIQWQPPEKGIKIGNVQVALSDANNALTFLMLGSQLVRRQWFADHNKAPNDRLIALQAFDTDLRMINKAIFSPQDSHQFERGVAALLFLLGFTSALPIETDSPDIILKTATGKLAIVECTTKTSDIHLKIGKLVDRRHRLSKAMSGGGHLDRVDSLLVCGVQRDQIAAEDSELAKQKVTLITINDLQSAIDSLHFPTDPDKLLDDYQARLTGTPTLFD